MDETYFGGAKGKPAAGDKRKTAVVGIVGAQWPRSRLCCAERTERHAA